MKSKIVILSLMFLSIIVGIVLVYYKFLGDIDSSKEPTSNVVSETITSEEFTLNTSYIGNNTWEYTVTGSLPNPCYSITVDPTVMESYPEQVVVNVNISNSSDFACIQVIQEVQESGTFSASSQAKISLEVIK